LVKEAQLQQQGAAMARQRTDAPPAPTASTWQQTIVDRARAGKLVPIIGRRLGDDLALGGHDRLPSAYWTYSGCGETAPARDALVGMFQYRSTADENVIDEIALRDDYVNFSKNRLLDLAEAQAVKPGARREVEDQFDRLSFRDFCDKLGYPRFDDPANPFLLLSSFDLPMYVTTDLHDFLELALLAGGKQPRSEFCRWHQGLRDAPSVFADTYEPTSKEPLVYHLFGRDRDPGSLVLTEDDHLKFLAAAFQDSGRPTDPIHKRVREALSNSSLMLLGYSLGAWDLRALFWGLIVPRSQRLKGVAIQLEPNETEKKYLRKYLQEYEFEVYWGDAPTYLAELRQILNV
jgi:hypothetical protein